jgi:hypothetical protein
MIPAGTTGKPGSLPRSAVPEQVAESASPPPPANYLTEALSGF